MNPVQLNAHCDRSSGKAELEDAGDFAPLAHVVGDDKENGSKGGQRDVAGQGRGDEQDQRAGADVGAVRAMAPVAGMPPNSLTVKLLAPGWITEQ